MARVVKVKFDFDNDPNLELFVEGHIVQATELAHQIASSIFGDSRWRFSDIRYEPPESDQLASKGVVLFKARELPSLLDTLRR